MKGLEVGDRRESGPINSRVILMAAISPGYYIQHGSRRTDLHGVRGRRPPRLGRPAHDAAGGLAAGPLRRSHAPLLRGLERPAGRLRPAGQRRGGGRARNRRASAEDEPGVPRRGRPRLGVVSREVSLLPRHWEWLEAQPSGISAAIRRLVEEARKREPEKERARRMQETVSRVLTALAGDRPGYEEASRALFAGDHEGFLARIADWPSDVRRYPPRRRCRIDLSGQPVSNDSNLRGEVTQL